MQQAQESVDMVGLERMIAADEAGDATNAMIQTLERVAEPIRDAMRKPQSRDDFESMGEVLAAIEQARSVLESVWHAMHPDRSLSR